MKKEFKVIQQESMYQGFFSLNRYQVQHTLFAGGWSEVLTRELFQRGNCVAVLLYDPDVDKLVIIEQFRMGPMTQPEVTERAWLLEIVAGAIEEGETAEEVAYRESEEEAGCIVKEMHLINEFYTSPGGASERISLFYGRIKADEVGGIHGLDEEHEDILVSTVSFDEAYAMIEDGRIESAIPIIAIQWLALNKHKLPN
ncbi:ADP-ribose pyrophosphatase [Bathymodiolus platifrons methanotrophic gill symbiont]|uniref:NUDIX domain-containing protein n=1 Tax=Bathymodiolus platifrons methanotrophic gill symbiont TaxID=113268 RepID=UPI000B41F279|nr:NUDIX domain-containing protein [Bathymodiolus platifrons methanotrophic gill symbiont]MCK5869949.1 NUDIX domain-containing protein [Methyloprofundus sp.]TXK96163.1 ADP-ribose diphosphatase [Methylococcaceae bacterium CS4]TXK97755.1 ADP-ribose diphosphatase [Methylococcaceae bacterium CS5]TXL05805.1 ADP-ribose diphosphatase [Methylococcaceae bacterium CS1]TXL08155.1 ADP-ribose diphosphatase [Methylococcaceae bacterium CS3]TXL10270.1 ADP-ribose diphosphatase [Methylococcaceae bacterium CS2]